MYQRNCVARNCKMRNYALTEDQSKLAKINYVISFHKFPEDEEKRLAWIEAGGKSDWKPSKDDYLCSMHFRDECIDEKNQLFEHAVPTIFFDDFRCHIKNIITKIHLNVNLESDASTDDEDYSLMMKSETDVNNSSDDEDEEIVECELVNSEDDFDEIECEEVMISEEDNIHENSKKTEFQKSTPPKNVFTSSTFKNVTFKSTGSEQSSTDEAVNRNNCSTVNKFSINTASDKNDAKIKRPIEIKNIKSNQLPLEPSDKAKKLFSMIKSGSFNKFSVTQPAPKSLVIQLLNIVKLANDQSDMKGVPDTYIITTKQESDDPDLKSKIIVMETSEIVSMITKMVQSIKDGAYVPTENVTIICGSPAIFLVKNISVKNCDRNMNSVYVITSENLLPHLYQLSTKREKIKKISEPTKTVRPLSVQDSSPESLKLRKILPKTTEKLSQENRDKLMKSTPQPVVNIVSTPTSAFTPVVDTLKTYVAKPAFTPVVDTLKTYVAKPAFTPVVDTLKTYVAKPTISIIQNKTIPKVPTAVDNIVVKKPTHNATVLKTTPSIFKSNSNVPTSTIKSSNVMLKIQDTNGSSVQPSKNIITNIQTQIKHLVNPNASIQIRTGSPSNAAFLSQNIKDVNSPRPIFPERPIGPTRPIASNSPRPTSNQAAISISPRSSFSTQATSNIKSAPQKRKFDATVNGSTYLDTDDDDIQVIFPPELKRIPNDDDIQIISPPLPKRKPSDNVIQIISSSAAAAVALPATEQKPKQDDSALLESKKKEIDLLEKNIIKKEREINTLKKKIQVLKKRYMTVKNPFDTKSDEQMVEDILSKYLEQDAVQFFVGQMKVSGKSYTQFRWSEEDKLFALSLLYKNPIEYNMLFKRFTLPSDKTLNKFVSKVKKAEMDEGKGSS